MQKTARREQYQTCHLATDRQIAAVTNPDLTNPSGKATREAKRGRYQPHPGRAERAVGRSDSASDFSDLILS
jgi:hypothetical protein